MAPQVQTPFLVTLTSPSAAGKSHLLNYIREIGYSCFVSTTTRSPRKGELEGVDYYFISNEESRRIEENDEFVELVSYNGNRYGITRKEITKKLSSGLAFLIVEPEGLGHVIEFAPRFNAVHLKYYIHTDPEVRLARFKQRVKSDVTAVMNKRTNGNVVEEMLKTEEVLRTVMTSINRLVTMTTIEMQWGQSTDWTRVLMGTDTSIHNLKIILDDVEKMKEKLNECRLTHE